VAFYDLMGRQMLKKKHIAMPEVTVERGDLKNGMYIYQVTGRNGIIGSGKIILW
jgi:hypothetical protein